MKKGIPRTEGKRFRKEAKQWLNPTNICHPNHKFYS